MTALSVVRSRAGWAVSWTTGRRAGSVVGVVVGRVVGPVPGASAALAERAKVNPMPAVASKS